MTQVTAAEQRLTCLRYLDLHVLAATQPLLGDVPRLIDGDDPARTLEIVEQRGQRRPVRG